MNDILEANMENQSVHQPHDNQEPSKQEIISFYKQQIIDTIYSHYGKPEKIIEEKFNLYTKYVTRSGQEVPAWNKDGWQRGRFSVYVLRETKPTDSFERIKIPKEGEGSWFFHTDGKHIKTFINGKKDATLEILRKS
tara:strand:- start:206 stop:616 length:411 start_codon:yes stop_codon:yes gene_type:complete